MKNLSTKRVQTLVLVFLVGFLWLSGNAYGLEILHPPGSWGDPCFQQASLSSISEEEDPETLYRQGLYIVRPLSVPQGLETEPCGGPDAQIGRALLAKAAEGGQSEAALSLGRLYQYGWRVEPDKVQAQRWYTKSAQLGSTWGMQALGSLWLEGINGPPNYSAAFKWLSKAAHQGNGDAAFQLSRLYEQGHGVTLDLDQALRWLQEGIRGRSGDAMYALGERMLHGDGVPLDKEEGLELIQKAASLYSLDALIYLGTAYLKGEDVIQDQEKGQDLLGKALLQAVGNGKNELVNKILQAGMSPNYHYDVRVTEPNSNVLRNAVATKSRMPKEEKSSILSKAAQNGRVETLRLLVKKGANPNARRTMTRKTPLWVAAAEGHAHSVEALIELGADPNIPSAAVEGLSSQTPLEVARAHGFQKVVRVLEKVKAIERPTLPDLSAEFQKAIVYRSLETNQPLARTTRRISTPLPDYVDTLLKDHSPIPPSAWIQGRKVQYQNLLHQAKFDILVVPFQVQHFGIDAIGRSLMTAYLVASLQGTTSIRIPNPDLVAKALGENARTYKKKDVYQLARALGVKTVVWGYVGHDRVADMRVTLQIQRRDESGLHENSPMTQWDSAILPFTDETPPEEVFRQLLPRIKQNISSTALLTLTRSLDQPTSVEPPPIPPSPQHLMKTRSTNPLHQSYSLQLLGTLFPRQAERAKERLFEQSLVALSALPAVTPGWRLLKARALFHLKRRPAALAVLGVPTTPSEKALLALLNGNLPELELQVTQIKDPINHWLTFFELIDLRHHYDQTERNKAELKILVDQFPEWGPLLIRRGVDLDRWQPTSNVFVKVLLDKAFPIPHASLQDMLKGRKALQQSFPNQITIEQSIRAHTQETLATHAQEWCCSQTFEPSLSLQYFDLLAALAEANLLHAILHQYVTQGDNTAALALLDQADPVYNGHPAFARLRSSIELEIIKSDKRSTNLTALRQFYQGFVNSMFWSGGQTLPSMQAVWAERDNYTLITKMTEVDQKPTLPLWIIYAKDVPRRSYWPDAEIRSTPEQYYENLLHSLKYAHRYFSVLETILDLYTSNNKRSLEGKALWEAHAHRFIGNPDRVTWMAENPFYLGNVDQRIEGYQTAIAQGGTDWEPYEKLGKIYISDGRFKDAKDVYESFPGFQNPKHTNPVQISHQAYNAGSALFWRGVPELATPLYRLSAGLRTGSGSSLSSEARLAMLDGDFRTAAKISLRRAKRYDSYYAYRDYLSLLHLLGHSKESWSGFSSLLGKYDSPQIWTSAFVGHRIEGRSDQDIQAWIDEQNERRPLHPFESFSARFAFMIFTIDRPPNDRVSEIIAKYASKYQAKLDAAGYTLDPSGQVIGPSSYKDFDKRYVILPSDYELGKPKSSKDIAGIRLKANQPVESHFALFAKGYTALRKKDYLAAFQWFEKRARYYRYQEQYHNGYAIPYFAWAAVKSGQDDAFRLFLDKLKQPEAELDWYEGFDHFLAEAFLAGAQGHHSQAIEYLKKAFRHRPHTEMRPLFSWYQVVEACEILFEDSGKEEYKTLALQWAKEYQVIQPMFAWAYGVEAKYSNNPSEKQRALALALFLDKRSERIREIPEPQKEQALKWLKTHNPFRQLPTSTARIKM